MARRPPVEDEDDPEDEEEEPPQRRRSSPSRPVHPKRGGRPAPVRRWSSGQDDEDEGDEDAPDERKARSWRRRGDSDRPPVFWRARDSLWFGPLVALAIVVVLVAGLFAYTQNWPPAYVVESPSMQHGPNDVLGVINTGDLVLAEKIPVGQIQTYVQSIRSGYSTYGEYGDVLLYWPNGVTGTPIIHRAILFLQYDPQVNGYNATTLDGLACGSEPNAVFSTPGTFGPTGIPDCGTTGLTGTLNLFGIGWANANVSVDLASAILGAHSGFLTMGDNNFLNSQSENSGCYSACIGDPDQVARLSTLVEPAWVLGVARGMLPWFGALKLALEGNTQWVPSQSWQFLGLTIAGVILLAFGIHYALRAEGIEDPRRRAQEEEEAEEEETEEAEAPAPVESRGRRILRSLRPWRRGDEEAEEEEAPPPRRPARRAAPSRRGRPKPHVRRAKKPKPRRPSRADEDDDA